VLNSNQNGRITEGSCFADKVQLILPSTAAILANILGRLWAGEKKVFIKFNPGSFVHKQGQLWWQVWGSSFQSSRYPLGTNGLRALERKEVYELAGNIHREVRKVLGTDRELWALHLNMHVAQASADYWKVAALASRMCRQLKRRFAQNRLNCWQMSRNLYVW